MLDRAGDEEIHVALRRLQGGISPAGSQAEGRYRAVEVHTGMDAQGRTEILSGLEAGQEVVVSGQFLIDSEASLSSALGRLEGDPAAA